MSEEHDRNLLTPAEVAKKVCPQTIARDSGAGPCVPEVCMAWRWSHSLTVSGGATRITQTHGYCGLAVKP